MFSNKCDGALGCSPSLPPRVQTPRLHAQPDSEERRGIDPVVGKAIVEKSGFIAAAILLAVLFEKFT